jgi:hypothetical protein
VNVAVCGCYGVSLLTVPSVCGCCGVSLLTVHQCVSVQCLTTLQVYESVYRNVPFCCGVFEKFGAWAALRHKSLRGRVRAGSGEVSPEPVITPSVDAYLSATGIVLLTVLLSGREVFRGVRPC